MFSHRIQTLGVAVLLAAAPLTAAAQPADLSSSNIGRSVYRLAKTPDGTAYIDSGAFKRDARPDLSAAPFDEALDDGPQSVAHIPTGLRFAKDSGGCVLTNFMGLPTPFGLTFQKGGRGLYHCGPESGASAIFFSFEADVGGYAERGEKLGRRLLSDGMVTYYPPKDRDCTTTKVESRVEVRCRTPALLEGQAVEERGIAFIQGGDTFVRANYACLVADCERATARIDRLLRDMGAEMLPKNAIKPRRG